MRKVFEFIYNELQHNRAVVSAVIVASSGSTPRSAGSRMAVAAHGSTQGSVGGGPGEAWAQREAHRVHQAGVSKLLKLDLTGKEAAEAGMICGGRQEILVEYIPAHESTQELFAGLLDSLDAGRGCSLCTVLTERCDDIRILARTLNPESFPDVVPKPLRDKAVQKAFQARLPLTAREENTTLLIEPIRSSGTLYIAGAGHVGKATADLAAYAGFRTIVLDDRTDFLHPSRFPRACKLHHVPEFAACFDQMDLPADSFIVIVTRGHVHDKTVLAQALRTPAQYIGMIGSRKKREAIYESLRGQGVSQSRLNTVHCPIGLSIGADTPEEIAVSIVGQLIHNRAQGE
ncbi:MAG: XdhC family protein [Desulfovermiculus sp.]